MQGILEYEGVHGVFQNTEDCRVFQNTEECRVFQNTEESRVIQNTKECRVFQNTEACRVFQKTKLILESTVRTDNEIYPWVLLESSGELDTDLCLTRYRSQPSQGPT